MKIWNFICGSPITNLSLCKFGGARLRRKFQIFSWRSLLLAYLAGAFSNAVAAENAQNEATPDLGFLEFLGQFETDAGEWIDPDSLLTEEFTELLDASADASSDGNLPNNSSQTDDATTDIQ